MNASVKPVRIAHLDAFRGLALLLVIGYHAYSRWPHIAPYGEAWAQFPLFKVGWMGVPLFFMISGFVILMTLEKCQGVGDFLYRRWLRLFPAMLAASALVFVTAGFFSERPLGSPSYMGLLPGLLFVEPSWLQWLMHRHIDPLEGVFWSLYVEFKFYVIAALLFYFARRDRFVAYLAALFAYFVVARLVGHFAHSELGKLPFQIADQLSLEHFGWFAAGAAYYIHTKHGSRAPFWQGLVLSLLNAIVAGEMHPQATVALVLIALLFAAVTLQPRLQRLVNVRPLHFFGVISYPLYLIHENMMVAWIVKIEHLWPTLPAQLLPIPALALTVLPAYLITVYAEPAIKRVIEQMLGKRRVVRP